MLSLKHLSYKKEPLRYEGGVEPHSLGDGYSDPEAKYYWNRERSVSMQMTPNMLSE
jgi:hypothetical protein